MSDKNVAKILAAWNPLDVPSYIAEDEYSSYVPILKGMGEAGRTHQNAFASKSFDR